MKGYPNIVRMILATGIMNSGKMSNTQPIGERVAAATTKGALREFKVLPGHKIWSHNTETGETEVVNEESYKGFVYITARPPFIYCSTINLVNAERKFKKIMADNAGFKQTV